MLELWNIVKADLIKKKKKRKTNTKKNPIK